MLKSIKILLIITVVFFEGCFLLQFYSVQYEANVLPKNVQIDKIFIRDKFRNPALKSSINFKKLNEIIFNEVNIKGECWRNDNDSIGYYKYPSMVGDSRNYIIWSNKCLKDTINTVSISIDYVLRYYHQKSPRGGFGKEIEGTEMRINIYQKLDLIYQVDIIYGGDPLTAIKYLLKDLVSDGIIEKNN